MGVPLEELWTTSGSSPCRAAARAARERHRGMVFGIFRQAAQPKLAMRLLERVVAPEALARHRAAAGRVPPRRSAIALTRLDQAVRLDGRPRSSTAQ